uniref:Uncharacterized protein LOC113798394 n=1 Tax=Dermatophagoides pteronyssinus TaxID=6956 RepID=A0A6P6YJ11_DERPT|nr:uncharacterized protein LOC113798394 [Dermatophagoides pteronyssinus]
MTKIIDEIQPCSEQAVQNWNLNHSYFVPSRLSTCCANWEVYECFIQAALTGCTLFEFQAIVNNMTIDAIILQRNNCSRFKYHSEVCSSNNNNDVGYNFWLIDSISIIVSLVTWFSFFV